MRRSTPFADIVRHLTPFFVSRQVVRGAGRVGIGQDGREHGFQISQRADYFEVEVGLETTLKRPIINTRDEPHADPEKYRRLHVIIGDANLAEISTYLKVGTTALVLAMIEDRLHHRATSASTAPVAALRAVSHDPTLQARLVTLADGRKLTAVQLQLEYLDLARKYVEDRLRRRRRRADRRRAGPLGVGARPARARPDAAAPASSTGWPSCKLLEQYRERDGLDWDDAKLQLIDLPVLRHPPREGPLPPAGRGRAGSSGCSTTPTVEARDARAARGHPRLLPRPLPGEVRRHGRRRLLGLGDLRPARAASRCSGSRPSTRCAAARRTSATLLDRCDTAEQLVRRS